MESKFTSREELAKALTVGGRMLDKTYTSRAAELIDAAEAAVKRISGPRVAHEQVYTDMEKAEANEVKGTAAVKFAVISFFVLAFLALLIPFDPFLSRTPLCGVFLGIGFIMLFSFMLGGPKRLKKKALYNEIIEKYGVDDHRDIEAAASTRELEYTRAEEATETALKFVNFACPGIATLADARMAIENINAKLKAYEEFGGYRI